MHHEPLLLIIAALCALAGAPLVLAPRWIHGIERALNRPWGGREVSAVRLGLPAERRAERWLNRPVLARGFDWDGWAHAHPRMTGLGLFCTAALLLLVATAL